MSKKIKAELPELRSLRSREGEAQWESMTRAQKLSVLRGEYSKARNGRHSADKAIAEIEAWKDRVRRLERELLRMITREENG